MVSPLTHVCARANGSLCPQPRCHRRRRPRRQPVRSLVNESYLPTAELWTSTTHGNRATLSGTAVAELLKAPLEKFERSKTGTRKLQRLISRLRQQRRSSRRLLQLKLRPGFILMTVLVCGLMKLERLLMAHGTTAAR